MLVGRKEGKKLALQTKIVTLYSQTETVYLLRQEGFDITERMLKYWRVNGDIPELNRNGIQWYYTTRELDAIRLFARRKQRAPEETLFIHEVEGKEFDVVGIEIIKVNGKISMLMHLRREGVLIREIEEGDIHALSADTTKASPVLSDAVATLSWSFASRANLAATLSVALFSTCILSVMRCNVPLL